MVGRFKECGTKLAIVPATSPFLNINKLRQQESQPRRLFVAYSASVSEGSVTVISNWAGETLPLAQSSNEKRTLAMPIAALAGTRTGP